MANTSKSLKKRQDKSSGDSDTTAPAHWRSRIQNLPRPTRYLLLVTSSLLLSSSLLTLISPQNAGSLAGISKHLEEWWEAGGLIAWRAVDLGMAWLVGFDGWDVTEFTVLTHLPVYFLMLNFYNVRPTAVAATFLIEVISKTIPFVILRGPNSVHALSSPRAKGVSNISILQDRVTSLAVSGAAAAIYTVVLFLGFRTWLPVHLVNHFQNIPDIGLVHSGLQGLPPVFVQLLLGGYAAYDLLFVSSAGWSATPTNGAAPVKEQGHGRNGEYLITSLYNRTWGRLSPKGRILANRTLILAAMTLANTIVQVSGTVAGVDLYGSAGWGALWSAADFSIAGFFTWVEAVPGV